MSSRATVSKRKIEQSETVSFVIRVHGGKTYNKGHLPQSDSPEDIGATCSIVGVSTVSPRCASSRDSRKFDLQRDRAWCYSM